LIFTKIENIVVINYIDYNLNANLKQNESGPIVDHYSVRTSDAGKKLLNAYQFYAVVQQEKWAHLKVDLETSLSHPKAHTQRKGLA
jgi:hypothetical protein